MLPIQCLGLKTIQDAVVMIDEDNGNEGDDDDCDEDEDQYKQGIGGNDKRNHAYRASRIILTCNQSQVLG